MARAAARAAIEAMREPTGEMFDTLGNPYGECVHDFKATWRLAIDAILA